MTKQEFITFSNDVQKANKIFKEQLNGNMLDIDLAPIYRNINKQKFNADMYGEPYISVFKGVSLC